MVLKYTRLAAPNNAVACPFGDFLNWKAPVVAIRRAKIINPRSRPLTTDKSAAY